MVGYSHQIRHTFCTVHITRCCSDKQHHKSLHGISMVDYYIRGSCTHHHHIFTVICFYENQRERGENMILPLSAIAMLIFGSVVLYGGLAYFLYKALKENKK